jgi:hypothetical protein
MGFKSKLSRDILQGKRRLFILYCATHLGTITNTPAHSSVPWPKQCDQDEESGSERCAGIFPITCLSSMHICKAWD